VNKFRYLKMAFLLMTVGILNSAYAQNQTNTYSPIFPETDLPYRIVIEQADFSLPNGIHSGVSAIYKGKWVFLAGRTNGVHGFELSTNNFPPQQQNKFVFVVDPVKRTVKSRSLADPSSGLTLQQIDQLSVTSPQSYQKGNTIYMTGGYGVDSATGLFSTKDVLTAIDIPDLIHWVTKPHSGVTLSQHIRQISNPLFKVTGGTMTQIGSDPTLLIFGQEFQGFYFDFSNGNYTRQVRRFHIIDDGKVLDVKFLSSFPQIPDPNFRRRDLNVVNSIQRVNGKYSQGLIALSGVFTPEVGIWTVPVEISSKGKTSMADPNLSTTFKQGMNNYTSATVGLFSKKTGDMFITILGGITFEFFQNGILMNDSEFPFTNEVTTVKRSKDGSYKQYLMNAQYPFITSTQSNPGNQLLFGAGAFFMPASHLPTYRNGVIKLDSVRKKKFLAGYIVGGIQSTLPNTNVISDSTASPYIFKVIVVPKR
jgi:hypothetical protein